MLFGSSLVGLVWLFLGIMAAMLNGAAVNPELPYVIALSYNENNFIIFTHLL